MQGVDENKFVADYEPFIDMYGLIQPEEGTTSDNGIRFTSEGILASFLQFGTDCPDIIWLWREQRMRAIEACQRIPGVLQRFPGCSTQEGVDDYYAAACVASLMNRPLAINMYLHGLDNFGVFKSTPSASVLSKSGNPFLWVQPGLIVHMKNCAKQPLSCIDMAVLKVSINKSTKSKEQDHKMLTWFIIRALSVNNQARLKTEITNWQAALIGQYGSIGDVLGEYYHPVHHRHPNAFYLKGYL
jgi:hypothetical protein